MSRLETKEGIDAEDNASITLFSLGILVGNNPHTFSIYVMVGLSLPREM